MGVRVNYIATTLSISFYISVFDSLTEHNVDERKKRQTFGTQQKYP